MKSLNYAYSMDRLDHIDLNSILVSYIIAMETRKSTQFSVLFRASVAFFKPSTKEEGFIFHYFKIELSL